jgi:hypothetical protein
MARSETKPSTKSADSQARIEYTNQSHFIGAVAMSTIPIIAAVKLPFDFVNNLSQSVRY